MNGKGREEGGRDGGREGRKREEGGRDRWMDEVS